MHSFDHDIPLLDLGLSRRKLRKLRGDWLDKRFIVGPVLGGDGSTPSTGRQAKTGETSVSQVHGKYYEAASRGVMFAAGDQGAGVVSQVTITTTGILSLHNPLGSQKRLAIKKVSLAYFNGTQGGGVYYHGFNPVGTTLPASGTLLISSNLCIGNQSNVVAVGVARTGATVVAATVLYPFVSSGKQLATTANPFTLTVEDVDGMICLEPGAVYQLVAVLGDAGASPKVSVGIAWEECWATV